MTWLTRLLGAFRLASLPQVQSQALHRACPLPFDEVKLLHGTGDEGQARRAALRHMPHSFTCPAQHAGHFGSRETPPRASADAAPARLSALPSARAPEGVPQRLCGDGLRRVREVQAVGEAAGPGAGHGAQGAPTSASSAACAAAAAGRRHFPVPPAGTFPIDRRVAHSLLSFFLVLVVRRFCFHTSAQTWRGQR